AEANVRRLGQLLGPVLLLLEGSAGGLLHDAEVGGAELAGLEVLERRLPLGAEAGEVREQELLLELADDTAAREVGDERRLRVPLEGAVARVDVLEGHREARVALALKRDAGGLLLPIAEILLKLLHVADGPGFLLLVELPDVVVPAAGAGDLSPLEGRLVAQETLAVVELFAVQADPLGVE